MNHLFHIREVGKFLSEYTNFSHWYGYDSSVMSALRLICIEPFKTKRVLARVSKGEVMAMKKRWKERVNAGAVKFHVIPLTDSAILSLQAIAYSLGIHNESHILEILINKFLVSHGTSDLVRKDSMIDLLHNKIIESKKLPKDEMKLFRFLSKKIFQYFVNRYNRIFSFDRETNLFVQKCFPEIFLYYKKFKRGKNSLDFYEEAKAERLYAESRPTEDLLDPNDRSDGRVDRFLRRIVKTDVPRTVLPLQERRGDKALRIDGTESFLYRSIRGKKIRNDIKKRKLIFSKRRRASSHAVSPNRFQDNE